MSVLSRQMPGPRASYDPFRTGDPIAPRPGDPVLGTGETSVGGASTAVGRRHPIGFAPPPETDVPARYRTELSFKRHRDDPRASASAGDDQPAPQPVWRTPASVPGVQPELPATAPVSEPPAAGQAAEKPLVTVPPSETVSPVRGEPGVQDEAVDADESLPDASFEEQMALADDSDSEDERVPFYRREIRLRRKKSSLSDSADPIAVPPAGPEVFAADATGSEPAEDETAAADTRSPEPVAETEVAPDADTAHPAESVPFYKREISFRRQPVSAPVPVVTTPSDAHTESDEIASTEPRAEAAPAAEGADAEPSVEAVPELDASDTTPAAQHDGETEALDATEAAVEEAEIPAAAPPAAEVARQPVADEEPKPVVGRGKEKERQPRRRRQPTPAKGGKVVGLKIGASQLAAAVVSEGAGGPELVALARSPLEAGIVVDGEVRDESALAGAIKAFFEAENLPRNDVRIGLSSNRIGVRALDIPAIDDPERFDNAVRFKAHEVLPVALSESLLDYRVLSESTTAEGETTRRVLLVVAPRDQVEPYRRVADAAGIRLAAADLEALALLRAFVAPERSARGHDDTATVVVGIGHEASTLLVAGGGECEFTRVFDWGGSALIDSIASALDVRPAEAAAILRHLSLAGPGWQHESLDETARLRATDAVRQRLTPFARELVNSLQFYQTQADSLGIGRIVITGGTSHLEGLDVALKQMIGVEVSVGDPLARVDCALDLDRATELSIGSLAVPIGLAIGDGASRTVNLLPKDASRRRRRDHKAAALAVGAPLAVAVPVAALALLYLGAHGKVADRQDQLDEIKAQIAALPEPKEPTIDPSIVGDEASRATSVARILGGRVAWDAVLRDFSRVVPANVWLTSVSFSKPDTATGATAAPAPGGSSPEETPSAVTIDGYTYSQPDVALLLARLATLPSLNHVTLTKSERTPQGKKLVVHFTIVADLAQNGGAS